jgi:hypothetical protein
VVIDQCGPLAARDGAVAARTGQWQCDDEQRAQEAVHVFDIRSRATLRTG